MRQYLLIFALCTIGLSEGLCQKGLLLASVSKTSTELEGISTLYNAQQVFKVFPNPAVNHIEISSNTTVSKVFVYDLVGKKVKSFVFRNGQRYFVGDLRKGIYLVQLLDTKNKILATKRIRKN